MSIKSKLQALLTAANSATGEADTDLTAAIGHLIGGFGQGGGGEIPLFFGDFTPTESVFSVSVETPGPVNNAVCFIETSVKNSTGRWCWMCAYISGLAKGFRGGTNNAGSSLSASEIAGCVTFSEDGKTVTFTTASGTGPLYAGAKYYWVAWYNANDIAHPLLLGSPSGGMEENEKGENADV